MRTWADACVVWLERQDGRRFHFDGFFKEIDGSLCDLTCFVIGICAHAQGTDKRQPPRDAFSNELLGNLDSDSLSDALEYP